MAKMVSIDPWKCDECHSEFYFGRISLVNKQQERNHPMFCPYCGRESNAYSEFRTTFKKQVAA